MRMAAKEGMEVQTVHLLKIKRIQKKNRRIRKTTGKTRVLPLAREITVKETAVIREVAAAIQDWKMQPKGRMNRQN